MTDEYAETVPRREYDALTSQLHDATKDTNALKAELQTIHDTYKRVLGMFS